jgi:hypothetical protein
MAILRLDEIIAISFSGLCGLNRKKPTDRGKPGSKVHPMVDEREAPLAILITAANQLTSDLQTI